MQAEDNGTGELDDDTWSKLQDLSEEIRRTDVSGISGHKNPRPPQVKVLTSSLWKRKAVEDEPTPPAKKPVQYKPGEDKPSPHVVRVAPKRDIQAQKPLASPKTVAPKVEQE